MEDNDNNSNIKNSQTLSKEEKAKIKKEEVI
jgi:hypothetical protein